MYTERPVDTARPVEVVVTGVAAKTRDAAETGDAAETVDATDDDDEDTVFNSVICKHTILEYSNDMCFSLYYGFILESDNKHLNDQNLHLQKLEEMSKTL